LAARGQHLALALRGPGTHCRNRPSPGQADPRAARGARGDPASSHVSFNQEARAILRRTVDLSAFVWQTANLAGFISGCYTNDLDMIRASLEDVVIEPQRQALIPGFQQVRRAALDAGALGCSISGAGPTIFAWARLGDAPAVMQAMRHEFAQRAIELDEWIVEIDTAGARIVGT